MNTSSLFNKYSQDRKKMHQTFFQSSNPNSSLKGPKNQKINDQLASNFKLLNDQADSPREFQEFIQKGNEDATQSISRRRINYIANASNKSLLQTTSLYPLFPTQIIIDLQKLTVIRKDLLITESVGTIPNDMLASVSFSSILFFASLKITTKDHKEVKVGFLPIEDAKNAKRIIQGLITCQKQNIDLTYLDPEKDLQKITDIGTSQN